jgi:hypothetical protein
MNHPISLPSGYVYIRLEDRKKPLSISDGVSPVERQELMKVVAEDPDHLEARLRLANVLEEAGEKAEALEIVTDGMPTLQIIPLQTGIDDSTSSSSSTRSRIQIPAPSL